MRPAIRGYFLPTGLAKRFRTFRNRLPKLAPGYTNRVVPVDDEKFQSLLDQVRELHRLADEATRERARFDAYVQARLRWADRNVHQFFR